MKQEEHLKDFESIHQSYNTFLDSIKDIPVNSEAVVSALHYFNTGMLWLSYAIKTKPDAQ